MKNKAAIILKWPFGRAFVLLGVFLGLSVTSLAQESDPFQGDPFDKVRSSLKVVYEVFSLPLGKAAALQREGLSDSKMYGRLVLGLKDDSVKLETFLTARGLSDGSMTATDGVSYQYPSSFETPEIPNMVSGPFERKAEDGKVLTVFPANPSSPSAYETRLLGDLLELKPKVKSDGSITLNIEPKHTDLLQKDVYGKGLSKVEYPRFAASRLQTSINTTSGKAFLLGTVSPPAEQQAKNGNPVTHFAFVTVTVLSDNKSPVKK